MTAFALRDTPAKGTIAEAFCEGSITGAVILGEQVGGVVQWVQFPMGYGDTCESNKQGMMKICG